MGKAKRAKQAANVEHELVGEAAKGRHSQPVAFLGALSEVADQPPLVGICLATIGSGVILRRRDVTRTGVRMLVAHALATGAKSVLKSSIDRTRPSKALADGEHQAGPGSNSPDPNLNSFPSGHTAGAVSVAQAIAHTMPPLAIPIRVTAAAIALIQLPRGKHYPSDIVVGAALGWGADQIAGALVTAGESAIDRYLGSHDEQRVIAEAEAHPS